MSDKSQKRRKMWAVVDDDGRGSQVFTSWRAAKAWAAKEPRDGTGWRVIPFVQRFSGDVVLSREEAALIRSTLVRLEEIASEHLGQMQPVSVLPLLRGGR